MEHDASEIWLSQCADMHEVLARHAVGAGTISGIGISSRRETAVLWDRTGGETVALAIVWQDRRTAQRCAGLRERGKVGLIQRKTGRVLDAYLSATKLEWLRDHAPGAGQRAERGELAFGTVDSLLVWKLIGGRMHATDVNNASRTLLFNLHTLGWDAELLHMFKIPASVLPQAVSFCGVLGETDAALLGAPVRIASPAGDPQAALFGAACFSPCMANNTYRTGWVMLMSTGTVPVPSRNPLRTTLARQGPQAQRHRTAYALEGLVFMSGAAVQWLCDRLEVLRSSAEAEVLAASVPDTGDVYLVPAFAGL